MKRREMISATSHRVYGGGEGGGEPELLSRAWQRHMWPVRRPTPTRFVNIGVWRGDGVGLREVPQKHAVLPVGEVCHLGVDIGPRNVRVRMPEFEAINEERLRWSPEMTGVWVEIAAGGRQ